MKLPTHKQFTDLIRRYLKDNEETPASFGRRSVGDTGAIPRLFAGRDPRLSTMHKMLSAMKGKKNDASGS